MTRRRAPAFPRRRFSSSDMGVYLFTADERRLTPINRRAPRAGRRVRGNAPSVSVRCRAPYVFLWMILAIAQVAHAQERYSPFVPSEESEVVRMLKLAGIRDGDVVFDLGSGDGRIV